MSEPTEDEINQVIDITGLDPADDRSLVIQALKNNNRNLETVISRYFDDADAFRRQNTKAGWDESMFAGERDGSTNNGISFHVEAPNDNDVIEGVAPPNYAPSRPPSRAKSRSPLGNMIDLTTAETAGVHGSQSQEDVDMERALRESAHEAGIPTPKQESGIMDSTTSQPFFGPAMRMEYDQDTWAMVPRTGFEVAAAKRVVAPSDRRRAVNAPALLLFDSDHERGPHLLGGLLTILHEIPAARNALIKYDEPAASYGHNGEWYKGQAILPPHIAAQVQGELSDTMVASEVRFHEELHRLMAFLDETERGYGSVATLARLLPDGVESRTIKNFYDRFDSLPLGLPEPLSQITLVSDIEAESPPSPHTCSISRQLGALEVPYSQDELYNITTLYEALDRVFWNECLAPTELDGSSSMSFFQDNGEVVTIQLKGEEKSKPIEIPSELYFERYLGSRINEAKQIIRAWKDAAKVKLLALDAQKGLVEHAMEDGSLRNRTAVMTETKTRFEIIHRYLIDAARFRKMLKSDFDKHTYPTYRHAEPDFEGDEQQLLGEVEPVIQWTESALKDLDTQMQSLSIDLERAEKKMRFLGQLLTVPNKERPQPFTCKTYHLRGICVTPDIIFLCRKVEEDLISFEDENKVEDCWWKLTHDTNASPTITAQKVKSEQVLREMWDSTKSPVLVYATDRALSSPKAALNPVLDRFVQADNKAFRRELEAEQSSIIESHRNPLDPMSPSKRKHRDSIESLNSNHASVDSMDVANGFEDPFEDRMDNFETEMETAKRRSLTLEEEEPPAIPPRPASRQFITTTEVMDLSPDELETESKLASGSIRVDDSTSEATEAKRGRVDGAPEMLQLSRPEPFVNPPTKHKPETHQESNFQDTEMDLRMSNSSE